MPLGNESLPEPALTKISVSLWRVYRMYPFPQINPCLAEFISIDIKIHLHFLQYLNTEMHKSPFTLYIQYHADALVTQGARTSAAIILKSTT